MALAFSLEDVGQLPPSALHIRQLEQEHAKLICENDDLRDQLYIQTWRPSLVTDPRFDMARRDFMSSDYQDRELERQPLSQNVDEVYLLSSLSHTWSH